MDVSPIIVDIETAGLPNASEFLDEIPDAVPDDSPIETDKRLTDPAKIAADLERKVQQRNEKNREAQEKVERMRIERLEQAGLDRNVGRIVAIGWWTEEEGIHGIVCRTEDEERVALGSFWNACRHRSIVGFTCKSFDLPFMVQRSRYLGIHYPWLDLGKYTRKGVIDLYLDLTFNEGSYDRGVMRRTLKAFCKRFGIPVTDPIDGKEIAALVDAGEWEKVAAHCKADVELTVALAHKLGIVREIPMPVEAAL